MSMGFSATITGAASVVSALSMASRGIRGVIPTALVSGGLLLENRWKSIAPYRTGTYRRSIHHVLAGFTLMIGTNVPYARRLEYGFSGADSLGRVYHQPAGGYARRAMNETRPLVIAEVVSAIRAQLGRLAA